MYWLPEISTGTTRAARMKPRAFTRTQRSFPSRSIKALHSVCPCSHDRLGPLHLLAPKTKHGTRVRCALHPPPSSRRSRPQQNSRTHLNTKARSYVPSVLATAFPTPHHQAHQRPPAAEPPHPSDGDPSGSIYRVFVLSRNSSTCRSRSCP